MMEIHESFAEIHNSFMEIHKSIMKIHSLIMYLNYSIYGDISINELRICIIEL